MELLTKLFDITKLPSKFFTLVFILSCAFTFLPKNLTSALNFDEFPKIYKSYVGVALVASGVILSINVLLWGWKKIQIFLYKRSILKSIEKAVNELDLNEIYVLREFVIQDRNVIELPIDHPTVAGLINKKIIQVTSNSGYRDLPGNVFPVQLRDISKKLLTNEILGLSSERLSSEEAELIRSQRPNFMAQIEKHDRLRGGQYW